MANSLHSSLCLPSVLNVEKLPTLLRFALFFFFFFLSFFLCCHVGVSSNNGSGVILLSYSSTVRVCCGSEAVFVLASESGQVCLPQPLLQVLVMRGRSERFFCVLSPSLMLQ